MQAQLFRDIYPYDEVQKTSFNHRRVPMNMPKEIWITDTTFRDGQQSRVPYTAQQIVDIFTLLHKLGGPKGLIRQCEFFVYTKKDREAVDRCMDLGYKFPEITTWIRATKEDWELQLMLKAQEITDKAFAEVITRIKPGMSELELQAELIYCLYKNGATGLAFDPIVVSGPNSSLPHGVACERVIQEGDFVTMDFGALYNGYCADMTRTVVVGKATKQQKEIYNTVLCAQKAGLETIAEGALASSTDAAAREVIKQAGYGEYFRHSLGHGVGMLVHELPNLSPTGKIVLKENMVVTCEPGIYIPDFGGVRIEDLVCVKKNGFENMTPVTKELIEL